MTKEHCISFVAAVSSDEIQMVKLYPEVRAEACLKIREGRNLHITSTDPMLNVFRVEARVADGGHNVPKEKIIR